jgi:phosphoglycolate phosphatase-like HAD superfamily hydrolase
MNIDCVVLDLDGTFTDLAEEAPTFQAAFPRLVADLVGKDLGAAWAEAERQVHALSPELGWTVEGQIVAPADADPYILASCAAQLLFDRFLLLADPGLRSDVTTALYRRAYQHTGAAFRPDAKAVLEALLDRVPHVRFVTNAAEDAAQRKLASLAPRGLERLGIRGDARKFLIGPASAPDARFEAIAKSKQIPGLARPVLLKRGRYFDALAAIWRDTGARPETTLVCGDIYELDLALPAELGAHVHFIRRPRTFDYELEAIRALGARGGASETLTPLLARLG